MLCYGHYLTTLLHVQYRVYQIIIENNSSKEETSLHYREEDIIELAYSSLLHSSVISTSSRL